MSRGVLSRRLSLRLGTSTCRALYISLTSSPMQGRAYDLHDEAATLEYGRTLKRWVISENSSKSNNISVLQPTHNAAQSLSLSLRGTPCLAMRAPWKSSARARTASTLIPLAVPTQRHATSGLQAFSLHTPPAALQPAALPGAVKYPCISTSDHLCP